MLATTTDYTTRFGAFSDTPKLTALLGDASSLCQQITEQTLEHVTGDVVYLDVPTPVTDTLFLPELPVTGVSEVKDNNVTVPVSDYWWFSYGKLQRPYSTWSREGPRTVKVTYDHGFSPVPDWLISLVCSIAYRGTQKSTTDAIRSQSFVDAYTVTYGSPGSGSQIGVTQSEYDQLCTLRVPVVAM